MRPQSWSLGLVGLGLLAPVQAATLIGASSAMAPALSATVHPRTVDLSGGLRLLLAPPDGSGQVAVCLGFVVGIATADRSRQAGALADLELRREHLAATYRERFGEGAEGTRVLEVLRGDIASLCVSVPATHWESAIAVALEGLRPVTVTAQNWIELFDRWHNHEGLASLLEEDPLRRQLQTLLWLGVPEAAVSVAGALEQTLSLKAEDMRNISVTNPQTVTLAVAGQYVTLAAEKSIRNNAALRAHLRRSMSRRAGAPALTPPQSRMYPRFARLRSAHRDRSIWLFAWPISQLDARHEMNLRIIAKLLEHRLNPSPQSVEVGTAQCELQVGRGFGSFVIEIRSRPTLELNTVEARVFSAVEQIRKTGVTDNELKPILEWAQAPNEEPINSVLDGARVLTQKSFFSGALLARSRVTQATPSEADVRRTAERDLGRDNVVELVSEAAPPPGPLNSSSKAKTAGKSYPRGRGRAYTVRNGETLLMIARRYRVTIPDIIRANGLHHPDQILPGTKIFIPESSPAPAPAK